MLINKQIDLQGNKVEALQLPLGGRNLIILKAGKGYGMCGYLDIRTADKSGDAAFKFSGAAGIEDALEATVCECSAAAAGMGIAAGQTVRHALSLLF